jgi:hypothetical protein
VNGDRNVAPRKVVLAIVLALFAIAHISGAFTMTGAHATHRTPAALIL